MNKKDCPFCNIKEESKITKNMFAFAIFDHFPVTPYHSLIILDRHVSDFFELTKEEAKDVWALIEEVKMRIEYRDDRITGWNVGVNVGEDAGQTVMHTHIHLIPRRSGDVKEPTGGVRGVIPEKQSY